MHPHRSPRPLAALLALLIVTALPLMTGCKADTCQRMAVCCNAVKDAPGMGTACSKLAASTRDPQTCASVLQTVNYMLEDRKKPVPQACALE